MGVKFKFTTKLNKFPDMEASLRVIDGRKINVGVTGEHAWLASIHEYGCDIKPVRAKYLTVPCNKKARGKKASDFHDLWFLQLDDGSKWLVRDKNKDEFEFMFALMKHVKIPERSFLRSGFDECHEKVLNRAERALSQLLAGTITEDDFYEFIGGYLRDNIQKYAEQLKTPPKSPLTTATNGGKKNPLVDTGDMINSIEFEVE